MKTSKTYLYNIIEIPLTGGKYIGLDDKGQHFISTKYKIFKILRY